MPEKAPTHNRRIPHWGWWLAATAVIVVAFVGIRFGLPAYRLQRTLANLRAEGSEIQSSDPHWLLNWIGTKDENWIAALSSSISIRTGPFGEFSDGDLMSLTGITELCVFRSKLTNRGLAHLARHTKLQKLSLMEMTDVGLVHLAGLKNLRWLDLNGTQITDAGLAHLAGLTNLERLGLGSSFAIPAPHITDLGLTHLSTLTNLKSLDLESTAITDTGLVHLTGLTSLQALSLRWTRVTAAGVASLEAAIPGIVIYFEN